MAAQVGLALQGKLEQSFDFLNDFPFYLWSSQTEKAASSSSENGFPKNLQEENYSWEQHEGSSDSALYQSLYPPVHSKKQSKLWPNETKETTPKCSSTNESSRRPGRKQKITIPPNVKRYRQLRRNARERERQGRLNNAFDVLRGVIPDYLSGKGPERKLTQIETLRLATHYIMALGEMLEDDQSSQHEGFCDCTALFKETSNRFSFQQ